MSGNYLVLVEKRLVLNLEALTVEGVVLRLLSDRSDEVVLLGDLSSLGSEICQLVLRCSQNLRLTSMI